MATANQLTIGTTLSIDGKLYRVESAVKVTVPKGTPFVKAKLRDLSNQNLVEKNFKPNQSIQEISLEERPLEFLYLEGKDYLFLDGRTLETLLIPSHVIGDKVVYLKEGIELIASFYGDEVFAVELPQFLELMVVKLESDREHANVAGASKIAILETGARIEVPGFVELGDIVKVDTHTDEYIQRV